MHHRAREGYQQHDARSEGGVDEVHADAAEHLLDHHDSDQAAEHGDQRVDIDGEIQRQQQAGDHCGQVADGGVALHDLAADVFEQDAGGDANAHQHRRTEAEDDARGDRRRHQGDNDVQHDAAGGVRRPEVRRGGDV